MKWRLHPARYAARCKRARARASETKDAAGEGARLLDGVDRVARNRRGRGWLVDGGRKSESQSC